MRNILSIIFAASFLILTAQDIYSQGQASAQKEQVLILYKGEVKIIPVNNPFRVVVSNPNIADVSSVSASDMLLTAKSTGATNLIWWDDRGENILHLQVFPEDMGPAQQRIDSFVKELNAPFVFTRRMDSEGRVLLLGNVKTAQDVERINVALTPFKDKIINLIQVKEEDLVIGIDVRVLELDNDATKTLGFTWPGSIELTDKSGPTTTAVTGLKNVFHVSDFTRSAFNIKLDALIQEGRARILSQPQLSCQSGKEAELLVGGEKPIMTTTVAATTGAQATQVEYKEFGIKLKIKPAVTDNKQIKLGLNVEVSEVGAAEILGQTNSPTARAYPLTKRNASTELYLNDGQTMAIGGLKKQKTEEDVRKTPILSDVPIVGALFRQKTTKKGGGTGERGDVELFITLTPTIVEKEIVKDKVKEREVITADQALSDYVMAIAKRIQDNFVYPWTAKEADLEGALMLGLRIYNTGQLLGAEIKKSSGLSVLDENAVRIVSDLAPYPSFPAEIKQEELLIDLPIIYKKK